MAYRQTDYTRRKTETSKTNLLLAAMKLFLVRGYHTTSMQQVVKAANTSIGNAYFYFKNKEDLLAGVVDRALSVRHRIIDRLLAALEPGPGRLAVNIYCTVLPPFSGAVVARQLVVSGADCVLMDAFLCAGLARNRNLLAENCPDLESSEIEFAANAWAGAGMNLVRARISGGLDGSPEDLSRQLAAWQLRALALGPGALAEARRSIDQTINHSLWPDFLNTIPADLDDLGRLIGSDTC